MNFQKTLLSILLTTSCLSFAVETAPPVSTEDGQKAEAKAVEEKKAKTPHEIKREELKKKHKLKQKAKQEAAAKAAAQQAAAQAVVPPTTSKDAVVNPQTEQRTEEVRDNNTNNTNR